MNTFMILSAVKDVDFDSSLQIIGLINVMLGLAGPLISIFIPAIVASFLINGMESKSYTPSSDDEDNVDNDDDSRTALGIAAIAVGSVIICDAHKKEALIQEEQQRKLTEDPMSEFRI